MSKITRKLLMLIPLCTTLNAGAVFADDKGAAQSEQGAHKPLDCDMKHMDMSKMTAEEAHQMDEGVQTAA